MTGPSGIIRDYPASGHEAAGDSATRGAKAPRRQRLWRIALCTLAAAGLLGGAAWALFGPQLLVVRSVVVTGTRLVPRAEVLAAAGIRPGTPLIRLNTTQIAARVDTIMQVRSARVSRSWPDRVVIVIQERAPVLALTAPDGGYALVDADGVVVRWAARRPAGLPLYPDVVPSASLRGDADLAAAAAVLGELPGWLRHSVVSVRAPAPDAVTLQLADGITVLWGGTDRAGAKAAELRAVMPTHLHYYDVSAPGSVLAK